MSETLRRVFEFVGTAGLGVAIALTCAYVVAEIIDIKAWRRRYKLQYGFNKLPLAKCYCKDCSWRSGEGLCDKSDRYVDQDFFCKYADPCDCEVK